MTRHQPDGERIARYKRGKRAEWVAAAVMMSRGYRILHLRYKTPVGEIDIVAKRGHRIAFVEVKQRRSLDDALRSITPNLRQRVTRASELWLRRHAPEFRGDFGFDVVALVPRRWPHYLKDAFDHR
ncbi:MAG: YraN family protein [Hyphomicrobiaceae bacterium]